MLHHHRCSLHLILHRARFLSQPTSMLKAVYAYAWYLVLNGKPIGLFLVSQIVQSGTYTPSIKLSHGLVQI